MRIKYFIGFAIVTLTFIVSVNLIGRTSAQEITNLQNIQYPIKELGDCKDQSACKSYCDNPDHISACLDFAKQNNLMSEEEIKIAKNFIAAGSEGPGGCKSKDECEQYCNDMSHINECIFFAEKNNLMSPKELEEAKKVQAAIAQGVKPPPCGNKKACDVYCEASEHMEECINFGAAAGFIQGKELADAQKMLQALKRGVKPPPCKGKEACDEYCSNPDNMEVCINFAAEAGMMSEQEKADSQKMLQALKSGVKPPNCKGKEGCDQYCGQEEHLEECTNFAVAAGFMSSEDAKMARKTGGKGPGGCKSKDECEAFCNNPDNQETCFNFAKDNGMISEEDLRQMGPSQQSPGGPGGCKTPEECQNYCSSNPQECQNFQQPMNPGSPMPGGEGNVLPSTINPNCPGPDCQFAPSPGGYQLPGEQMPPAEQLPIEENPPPPPSSLLNFNSFLGSVAQSFLNLFSPGNK